jgi:peptidoglycan/LPS O-acetylase OafA/YrhL
MSTSGDSRVAEARSATLPAGEQATAPLVSSLTKSHFPALDGLRGLAILLVVVYHFGRLHPDAHSKTPGLLLDATQLGWMGVDLFFILSGFLITSILWETKDTPGYFRNFLGRRFLRIWPLYYLNLVAFFLVLPLVLHPLPDEMRSMVDDQGWFWLYAANWLFALQGDFNHTSGGYFWSLAVEEQFYIVWPLVVFWLGARRLVWTCATLLAISFASRIVLVSGGVSTSSVYAMTFTHLDGLAIGAALAVGLRSPRPSAIVSSVAPIGAVLALLAMLAVRALDGSFLFWNRSMAMYGYTIIAIGFGCLLVLVLKHQQRPVIRALFTNRFMIATGRYSYALYLAHVPIATALYQALYEPYAAKASPPRAAAAFAVFALIAFATSWAAAWASWHVFEKRVLALKRYFAYA